MYGFPVTTADGKYTIVQGLPIDDFSREKMNATLEELEEERAGVAALLEVRRPMSRSASPGARFRAALAAERPLQVPGAINAYHAILAEKSGFRAIYLSGGGVAAGSLGLPDLGISNLDDVLTDVRRITDVVLAAAAGRRRHRLRRERVQHRAHGEVADQVRRRRRCTSRTRSAPSAAATGRARRSSARTRWSTAIKAAVDARTDADFVVMARTDALAVEGLDAAIERARRLRRGRRRHDLPRGDHRPCDVPALRRRGEGADPRQHHRVRRDAALHRRRAAQRRTSRSRSIRCRRSAR